MINFYDGTGFLSAGAGTLAERSPVFLLDSLTYTVPYILKDHIGHIKQVDAKKGRQIALGQADPSQLSRLA